jgi:hypothetical protein
MSDRMNETDEADEGTERLSLAEKFKRAGVDFHPPKDGKLSDR